MAGSLERKPSSGSTQRRSYQTAKDADELFELLDVGARGTDSDRSVGSNLLTVRDGDEFTIYRPWTSLMDGVESRVLMGVTPGVAVRGLISETERGAKVEVWADRYAVDPEQRRAFRMHVVAAVALGFALTAIGGLETWLGFVYIFIYANVIIGTLTYRSDDRERELRDLMAAVERRLGPLELAALDEGPHRALPRATTI